MNGVATFTGEDSTINGLNTINFFFGGNGTGKTSIGRVIAEPDKYPGAAVLWNDGQQLETLVYNRDFIDRNLMPSEIPGVFTLGDDAIQLKEQIAAKRVEIDGLKEELDKHNVTLNEKKQEKDTCYKSFMSEAFPVKDEYYDKYRDALKGHIKSKDAFATHVLEQYDNNNAEHIDQTELQRKARVLFSDARERVNALTVLEFDTLIIIESNTLLQKVIVGRNDVDIARLIDKLDNSDWVRKGTEYLDDSEEKCPFCQQPLAHDFRSEIAKFFDDSYEADCASLDQLAKSYHEAAERMKSQLQDLAQTNSAFVDSAVLKLQVDNCIATINNNNTQVNNKCKNPSQTIVLTSIQSAAESITRTLREANERINEHNALIDNNKNEKDLLIAQVWRSITERLSASIKTYRVDGENLDKAITSLGNQIAEKSAELQTVEAALRELEARTTCINPTADRINEMLGRFSFTGFTLETSEDEKAYRLVRDNRQAVEDTLSEGEKCFVSFLYFYYLLEGSKEASGTMSDRVVVIDDPVSSLDADIIYVVSSLTRQLCEKAKNDKHNIKQVFILTHNVVFHKEVSFDPKRDNKKSRKYETFNLVRKCSGVSTVERTEGNPISTTYQRLWDTLKNGGDLLTARNTMRRILENFFRLLGYDLHKSLDCFTGEDRVIARSLLSWLHAGSHSAFEEDEVIYSDTTLDRYLVVFRALFEKTNQLEHYEMMMGENVDSEIRPR
jgi:wobble nucleotide-excising tRNase